jgi:hypothetical protein
VQGPEFKPHYSKINKYEIKTKKRVRKLDGLCPKSSINITCSDGDHLSDKREVNSITAVGSVM